MNSIVRKIVVLLAGLILLANVALASSENGATSTPSTQQMAKKVRHELVMLPYYGVFDNLAYRINGSTVTLYGQVTRPVTRADAQQSVARLAGVTSVVNNIEVLPLSSFDDSIRLRTYRSVFSTGGLYRYAMGANPSIHIIVDRGNVTLEGVVNNKMDAQLAYMAANRVPGVFSVTNRLHLEHDVS